MIFEIILAFSYFVISVSGHGRMIEPPQRSSLWRVFKGQGFEENYNDNELFCGGFHRQYFQNDGKCGTCGDPYDGERKNEAGGVYATGFIARRYQKGQDIEVEIQLTANHLGSFQFKICPNNDITTQVTQECLDQHVLELAGQLGETRYKPGSVIGSHFVKIALPPDMTCEQCVLQWHYTAGNNHNCDTDTGKCCIGCGPQETFINCADIAIDDDANNVNPTDKTTTSRATTSKLTTQTKSPTTKEPTTRTPSTTMKATTRTSPTMTSRTTSAPSTTTSRTTSAPSTTKSQPPSTTSSNVHVNSCGENEVIDCIGVGVFDGLGYEGWCNSYCGDQLAACTADLCQCRCIRKATCTAIGDYETIPGMDQYCNDSCQYGCDYLSDMCSCD